MKNRGWLKSAFTLLTLVALVTPALADEEIDYQLSSKDYWKSYVDDGKYLASSPSRWDSGDWRTAGKAAGIAVGLYLFDRKLLTFAQQNRADTTDNISSVFQHAGEEVYVFPALFALYVYGDNFDNQRASQTALLSVQSWVYSSVLTLGLQQTIHRYPPNLGLKDYSADGAVFSRKHVSFPSSPSSTAFAVASVVAGEYDDSPYVGPVVYTVASLAALSTINYSQNWPSDVFVGAAIGYFIGNALVNRHPSDSGGKITIIPVINSQNTYILVDFSF